MIRFVAPIVSAARALSGGYRREITNMSWLFFDRFVRVLGNFLIGILAAHMLGPASYGGISYAQALSALLLLVASLGLNQVVVKRLIEHPDQAPETLGTAFSLQAFSTLLTMSVTIAAAFMTRDSDRYAMLVAIVAAGLVLRPTEVFRYWFEAHVNARRAVFADNVAFLISVFAKVGVLYVFRSVEGFAWTLAAEQVLIGICLFIAYRTDRLRRGRWVVSMTMARRLIAESWPLFFSGLAVVVYMRIDQFVIMATHGAAETGVYAAAVRLSEIVYVLPTIVATSFFPRWQSLLAASSDAHRMAVRSTMTAMVVASAAIALTVSLAADPFVHLLYDQRYDGAVPVLAIHIWTSVFVSMGILGNQWYLSHNLQSRTLLCTVLGAGANFLINLALVPAMGATGGAIASLTAQIIATFFADAFSARTRPLFAIKAAALAWPLLALRRVFVNAVKPADQHG